MSFIGTTKEPKKEKKIRTNTVTNFQDDRFQKMVGNGISFKGNDFVTHSDLDHNDSAIYTVQRRQKVILFLIVLVVSMSLVINWKATIIVLVALSAGVYFIDLLFNLFLIFRSFHKDPEIVASDEELARLDENALPMYTIFCPLYEEWQVVPQFVQAIKEIDWPKHKLDVQMLLEEDDKQTIEKIRGMNLPPYFRIIVVPHSEPKTKPKACNYGLSHAKGEFAVIFDAEDVPEPNQLKKAFVVFKKMKAEGVPIICAQAKLNFYNPRQNLLTRMFTAEYSLWFDLILTGLQSIRSPIPLGGTSNHFLVKDLQHLKGWDPFNVTEDCDLGMRITKRRLKTVIFNSTTMEEANSDYGNWLRQRSRWIKGYIQTYLVHMRRPGEFITDLKDPSILTFQLIVGGKIMALFLNPLMWTLTIVYFVFRAQMGEAIAQFYPAPVFYLAIFSLVFGNFLYFYYYMIGCAKREQWDLIKYMFLIPIYWLMMSVAAWKALWQLIFKPHYWEKTVHGLHLKNNE